MSNKQGVVTVSKSRPSSRGQIWLEGNLDDQNALSEDTCFAQQLRQNEQSEEHAVLSS